MSFALTSKSTTSNLINLARLSGLLYLTIILCGVWAEGFVRAPLISDNPRALSQALSLNLTEFRLSLLADATMVAADITLAVLLYTQLHRTAPVLTALSTAFRLAQATTIAAGLSLLALVPWLLSQGDAQSIAMLFQAHAIGYDVGLVFFGLNSLLMCAILLQRDVPLWIATGIGASGLVYLAGSVTRLVAPELNALLQPAYALPLLAESAFCLWLLIRGRL